MLALIPAGRGPRPPVSCSRDDMGLLLMRTHVSGHEGWRTSKFFELGTFGDQV
jgi:hypothetical protein